MSLRCSPVALNKQAAMVWLSLKGVDSGCQGSQSNNHKELNYANSLNELGMNSECQMRMQTEQDLGSSFVEPQIKEKTKARAVFDLDNME